MKVAVEVFVDSILLLLITAASVFFIVISLMTADARNFHSTSVAKIEASDGSQVVMEECMAEAREKGYRMEIVPTCLYEDKSYYYVTVSYDIQIPVSGFQYGGTVEGYAR